MSKNTELLGVKVKSDTKERISEIIEKAKAAGMIEYNGDIFDLFVERFKHDELTTKMEYGADLKELNQITRRVNDIFINLAERNKTNIEAVNVQHENTLLDLNKEISDLKERENKLKEELTEKIKFINELTDLSKVNQDRLNDLEDAIKGYTERIDEQKNIIKEKDEKIANKNEMISVKEEVISAMKEDISLNEELKNAVDSLKNQITSLEQTITSKNEELERQRENLEFECQKRIFVREQELSKEKEKEVKTVQEELAKETKRYQEKYEKVLDEKDKIGSANYELKLTLDRANSENEKKDALIDDLQQKIKQLESALKKKP